jgi:hypothetical protein
LNVPKTNLSNKDYLKEKFPNWTAINFSATLPGSPAHNFAGGNGIPVVPYTVPNGRMALFNAIYTVGMEIQPEERGASYSIMDATGKRYYASSPDPGNNREHYRVHLFMDEGDSLELWNDYVGFQLETIGAFIEFDKISVNNPLNGCYYHVFRGIQSEFPKSFVVPAGYTARVVPFSLGDGEDGERINERIISGISDTTRSSMRLGLSVDGFNGTELFSWSPPGEFRTSGEAAEPPIPLINEGTTLSLISSQKSNGIQTIYTTLLLQKMNFVDNSNDIPTYLHEIFPNWKVVNFKGTVPASPAHNFLSNNPTIPYTVPAGKMAFINGSFDVDLLSILDTTGRRYFVPFWNLLVNFYMDEGDSLEWWNNTNSSLESLGSVLEFDKVGLENPINGCYYKIFRGVVSDLPLSYTVPVGFTARITPFIIGGGDRGTDMNDQINFGVSNTIGTPTDTYFKVVVNGIEGPRSYSLSPTGNETFSTTVGRSPISIFSEGTTISLVSSNDGVGSQSIYMTLLLQDMQFPTSNPISPINGNFNRNHMINIFPNWSSVNFKVTTNFQTNNFASNNPVVPYKVPIGKMAQILVFFTGTRNESTVTIKDTTGKRYFVASQGDIRYEYHSMMDEGDVIEFWSDYYGITASIGSILEFDKKNADEECHYHLLRGIETDFPITFTVPPGKSARLSPFRIGGGQEMREISQMILFGASDITVSKTFNVLVNGISNFDKTIYPVSSSFFKVENVSPPISLFAEGTTISLTSSDSSTGLQSGYMVLAICKY